MKINFPSFKSKLWISGPLLALIALALLTGWPEKSSATDDIDDLNALIDNFQEAYSNKDSLTLRSLFFSNAIVAYDFEGGELQRTHSRSDWLQGTEENTFADNQYISDNLTNRQIETFRNIAYAVCDYRYESDTEIGTGKDIFTFLKMRGEWKIVSLQYTGEEDAR